MGYVKRTEISGVAVADAGGIATVILNGPASGSCVIDSVAVICSVVSPLPSATMYAGPTVTPGRIMAVLRAADVGTFRGDGDVLESGQQITVQFTNAAPGATCRVLLRGTTRER
jgi:hypothetical protein